MSLPIIEAQLRSVLRKRELRAVTNNMMRTRSYRSFGFLPSQILTQLPEGNCKEAGNFVVGWHCVARMPVVPTCGKRLRYLRGFECVLRNGIDVVSQLLLKQITLLDGSGN